MFHKVSRYVKLLAKPSVKHTQFPKGLNLNLMNIRLKSNIAVSDNGFVFDSSTGDSYSVNPIGVEIIQLMKENKSSEEIIQSLEERYEVDAQTIDRDLYEFVQVLLSQQLAEKL